MYMLLSSGAGREFVDNVCTEQHVLSNLHLPNPELESQWSGKYLTTMIECRCHEIDHPC
jgi:hypothetical protein